MCGKFRSKLAKLFFSGRFRLFTVIVGTFLLFRSIEEQWLTDDGLLKLTTTAITTTTTVAPLPRCTFRKFNNTGVDLKTRITVNKDDISEADLMIALSKFIEKEPTQFFRRPANCTTSHRVAVIIPFRGRESQLRIFLRHMHPFLSDQQIEYEIFVVQQRDGQTFNRGKLMNVGFDVARRFTNWTCYIFHDVDLLPEDARNFYACSEEQPRHLSVAVDKFRYRLPYSTIFGGACAMTEKQVNATNGFPNSFWGWGGEDDDLSRRTRFAGYKFQRYSSAIGRYKMLPHKRERDNSQPLRGCTNRLLRRSKTRWQTDGINTLNYDLVSNITKLAFYTTFVVDLFEKESLAALKKDRLC